MSAEDTKHDHMEVGIDSFIAATIDRKTGQAIEPVRHLRELLEAITLADEVGLDVFGIGEHHRLEFLDSAPTVILAAAGGASDPLTSAVTMLARPIRADCFKVSATLDLFQQQSRVHHVRRSLKPFTLQVRSGEDYDSLLCGKLDLLLEIGRKAVFIGRVSIALPRWRRSIPASRCKTHCQFGSVSEGHRPPLAQACSDFP
jgi:hypothetical protein